MKSRKSCEKILSNVPRATQGVKQSSSPENSNYLESSETSQQRCEYYITSVGCCEIGTTSVHRFRQRRNTWSCVHGALHGPARCTAWPCTLHCMAVHGCVCVVVLGCVWSLLRGRAPACDIINYIVTFMPTEPGHHFN